LLAEANVPTPPAPIASAEEAAKSVATVRVTHKGYAMELSSYVAYALSEGVHELYTHPAAAQPSRAEVLEQVRAKISAIPTRMEQIGGQSFKYVKLHEVLDALDALKDKP
jgi:hypothetical protein